MAELGLSFGMWDLVPWPGIEPMAPAPGAQSLSHWTTREVPGFYSFTLSANISWAPSPSSKVRPSSRRHHSYFMFCEWRSGVPHSHYIFCKWYLFQFNMTWIVSPGVGHPAWYWMGNWNEQNNHSALQELNENNWVLMLFCIWWISSFFFLFLFKS